MGVKITHFTSFYKSSKFPMNSTKNSYEAGITCLTLPTATCHISASRNHLSHCIGISQADIITRIKFMMPVLNISKFRIEILTIFTYEANDCDYDLDQESEGLGFNTRNMKIWQILEQASDSYVHYSIEMNGGLGLYSEF